MATDSPGTSPMVVNIPPIVVTAKLDSMRMNPKGSLAVSKEIGPSTTLRTESNAQGTTR